ncbi:MAG: ATP phosphoribosyltransferase [Pseudomonadota bacterium]
MTLHIAVPSKGRLKEHTLALFDAAGLPIETPADQRAYRSRIAGRNDVEIMFVSASEITRELATGSVHLGITGEDLARENIADVDTAVRFKTPLGFGHADVVVAVPQAWVDVVTMADLDDIAADFRARYGRRLRVATKYWQLTQGYFRRHGIGVYRIVESLGATEGAPAAGTADAIVDITSTGSTIRANRLKVLDDGIILQSQANLIRSNRAAWDAHNEALATDIVSSIKGAIKGAGKPGS